MGVMKINVDAAVRKQGNVGAAAAACRSDAGQYMGASAVVMQGSSDPTILEAVACHEALALAQDLHLTRIRVFRLSRGDQVHGGQLQGQIQCDPARD